MKKVFLLLFASFCFGIIAVATLTGPVYAKPPSGVPPQGGIPQCEEVLAQCEADSQVFPGDGYTDPSFVTIGHGPALSYTDNLDGTFTDNNTGYMWEIKTDDGSVHDVDNEYTWSTGAPWNATGTLFTVFLDTLNDVAGGGTNCFAGYCDWCIPNAKKLQSIVDYSKFDPASSVPGLTSASFYWSSTTLATLSNVAWTVIFSGGYVNDHDKDDILRARAVRPCP